MSMKILFLDQSGQLGGAKLSLTDVAKYFKDECLVCLFKNGPFIKKLTEEGYQLKPGRVV